MNNKNRPQPNSLPSLMELRSELPAGAEANAFVEQSRGTIRNIIFGQDARLLVIAGPCSISHLDAAAEYARRLRVLAADVSDVMYLVMRTYFQKPRTSVGWKGLVYDPHLDGKGSLGEGLRLSRRFLLELAEQEVPAASEAVDTMLNEYTSELVSWTAIGARTTESQIHREYVSGLPCPTGFKNRTDGAIEPAVCGVLAARSEHCCLGLSDCGTVVPRQTEGNPDTHIVMRGGTRPNYDCVSVRLAEQLLRKAGLEPKVVVDCSHGNSGKEPAQQAVAFRDCLGQLLDGPSPIRGLMLESNLLYGSQKLGQGKPLPGLSITDGCLDWETTADLVLTAAERLRSSQAAAAARSSAYQFSAAL